MKSKGFTLIELLVVIAIIGILSSVVLASLNTARNKGADSAVKSNLANQRAEAEIFYDKSNAATYDGVCAVTGENIIGDGVNAAAKAGGATYTVGDNENAASNKAVCHDAAGGWAAAAPIKNPVTSGNIWCVDSTGAAKEVAVTALDADGDIACD